MQSAYPILIYLLTTEVSGLILWLSSFQTISLFSEGSSSLASILSVLLRFQLGTQPEYIIRSSIVVEYFDGDESYSGEYVNKMWL